MPTAPDFWLLDDDQATPLVLERHWGQEHGELPVTLEADELDEESVSTWALPLSDET